MRARPPRPRCGTRASRHRLPRVIAITSLDNVASGRLLERIGLQQEGTLRLAGSNEEVRIFGTTRAYEFDAPNARPVFDNLWTSGQLSASDIQRLPEFGIEAVVNLALPTASNACPAKPRPSRGRA